MGSTGRVEGEEGERKGRREKGKGEGVEPPMAQLLL
jgi:hypothetical protein